MSRSPILARPAIKSTGPRAAAAGVVLVAPLLVALVVRLRVGLVAPLLVGLVVPLLVGLVVPLLVGLVVRPRVVLVVRLRVLPPPVREDKAKPRFRSDRRSTPWRVGDWLLFG